MILFLVEGGLTYASDIQTVGVSLCPGYGASLSGMQVSGDRVRRGAGDFIRHCISGVTDTVLYCRSVGRACMAGDRVSDKPLWSANGGGLAGRDDRRSKPRAQGFCIWINLWAGHIGVSPFFSLFGAVSQGSFFYLEGSHERHNTAIYLSGFLCV